MLRTKLLDSRAPTKAKILVWDIECSHLKADFGTVLCIGWKWLDEKTVHCPSIMDYKGWRNDPTDDSKLIEDFYNVLCQADILVTFNGIRFDLKYIRTKLLEHNLNYLPRFRHVDLYQVVRHNMNTARKNLDTVSRFLKLPTEKTPVEGRVWKRAMTGHVPSLKQVIHHCKKDILVTEALYYRLRPLIQTHPPVKYVYGSCAVCGCEEFVVRGLTWNKSKGYKQKKKCSFCGTWAI